MRQSASIITTAASVAALLGSLAVAPVGTASAAGSATASDVQQGKEIAFNRKLGNCLACHKIDDGQMPGNIGPPLNNMKQRFPDRSRLYAQIYDAHKFNPNSIMPPFGKNHILTVAQINKVVDYLYTQ
ncbi:MAG: sulfur oxidation c-type cytochrome SoxX [Gammaproteobacteria bacterium]|jgi:L-cysteine S-thiosulfotransferase